MMYPHCSFFFFFYLASSSIGCSMQGLCGVMQDHLLWCMESLVVACGLSCSASCGILVPRPEIVHCVPYIARQILNCWVKSRKPAWFLLSFLWGCNRHVSHPGCLAGARSAPKFTQAVGRKVFIKADLRWWKRRSAFKEEGPTELKHESMSTAWLENSNIKKINLF